MKLIDFITASVDKYGGKGDNSFEYIGMNIENSRLINTKLYRRGENALTEFLLKTPYSLIADKLSEFRGRTGIGLCDISESICGGVKSFRVVFSIPQNISQGEADNISDLFFNKTDFKKVHTELKKNYRTICNFLNIDYSPLMQLGAEFDEKGNFLAVKYYLSVKPILDRKTVINQNLMKLFEKWDISPPKIETVCKNGYYPIFIGANADEEYTEYKLYFISEYLNRKTDIREKMQKLFQSMKWDFADDADINKVIDLGLFAEGIALSANGTKKEKAYLNFLPKNINVSITDNK